MAGFSREVAKRIFAEELKSSNYSFREGEDQHQYAPQYLLTPTGAKCNRVFVVGTLTEKDDIGGDTEYWRGRVVDPTGSILIYAGQYQPEAAQILASIEAPSFVAVVGKPNLYQTDDGNIIISLRAESIQTVDENTRNRWIMDTSRRTLERLQALKDAKPVQISGDFATADNMLSSNPAQDTQRALQHYNTDIDHFRQMVLRALASLRAEIGKGAISQDTPTETKTLHNAGKESDIRAVAGAAGAGTEETPASRKAKVRKSESLDSWPTPNEEEVESINFSNKS